MSEKDSGHYIRHGRIISKGNALRASKLVKGINTRWLNYRLLVRPPPLGLIRFRMLNRFTQKVLEDDSSVA